MQLNLVFFGSQMLFFFLFNMYSTWSNRNSKDDIYQPDLLSRLYLKQREKLLIVDFVTCAQCWQILFSALHFTGITAAETKGWKGFTLHAEFMETRLTTFLALRSKFLLSAELVWLYSVLFPVLALVAADCMECYHSVLSGSVMPLGEQEEARLHPKPLYNHCIYFNDDHSLPEKPLYFLFFFF